MKGDLLECSNGFRPNRNAHDALRATHDMVTTRERIAVIAEADIRRTSTASAARNCWSCSRSGPPGSRSSDRSEYVSWLNLVEVFFSKLERTLLHGIRATSPEQLGSRIIRHLEVLNEEPVIFRWKYRLDQVEGARAGLIAKLLWNR